MARKLRIRVDHATCVGNAMCETFAPNVFRLNENRQSEAVDPAGDTIEQVLKQVLYEPSDLARRVKSALEARVKEGAIRPKEGVQLADFYEEVMKGYTYLRDV